MSSSSHPRWQRTGRVTPRAIRLGVVGTLVIASAGSGTALAATTPGPDPGVATSPTGGRSIPRDLTAGRYVITFAGSPAATYTGGLAGLPRTAPAKGGRLSAHAPSVRAYVEHLQQAKRRALRRAGVGDFTDYSIVLNGAAADLSAEQAKALAGDPSVISLAKDRMEKVLTNRSPQFLGVPSLWKKLGGRDRAGAGIVVGDLDTGIWPESESFKPNGTPIPSSFTGTCQTGQEWSEKDCNDKIVGARYYVDGFGRDRLADDEYLSPRDGDSHGTHTASTAVGDRVDGVTVSGNRLGTISGMAPGAKVAAYKVCWSGRPGVSEDGCKSSDIIAAVNDAVRDGVNVINFSIGGTTESPVNDPQELAFLNAAAAGVFVSASAGNSGPGASTADHPSPWLTTVAASTFKVDEAALLLGDGRRFVGASSTAPLTKQTPMVLASAAAAAGRSATDAGLCQEGTLDAATVKGKLVVCLRGGNGRAEKSWTVKAAGGAGMVLVNPTVNSLNGDLHHVPSVHLQNTAYEPVTDYARKAGATGAIVPLKAGESRTKAPEVAEFSSRGPSTTTEGNLLKPDLAAPGVDVLAAVTPGRNHGRNYDMLSGTSMAAPHVSGLAALLMATHRDWTPMMVKSALMTTARDMASRTSPFAQGAGNVRPALATDPGVVFDSGLRDWVSFLKGQDLLKSGAYPTIGATAPSNLNLASIAVGSLAGSTTVTRTLRSVSKHTETYSFDANAPGAKVTATPGEVTLRPGESRTVSIAIRRTTAKPGAWTTGSVSFRSNAHTVRLPVALRPVELTSRPAEVTGSGAAGHTTVQVTPGTNATVTAGISGLVGTTPQNDTVQQGDFDQADPAPGPAVKERTFTVPAGTAAVRFDTTMSNPADDLDLYVYRVDGDKQELVDLSGTGTGNEQVVMTDPKPGTYKVYVAGYTIADAGDYTFRGWVVPRRDAGNLRATPASFAGRQADTTPVALNWSGLDTTKAWFGMVDFTVGGRVGSRTAVLVANR